MMRAFKGYIRPDGTVGIRNDVIVLAVMDSVNGIVLKIANAVRGAIPIPIWYGRGQFGADEKLTTQTLISIASNPNVAAALVVSLEPVSGRRIADAVKATGKPVDYLAVQDERGSTMAVAKGMEMLTRLAIIASTYEREEVGIESLVVGVECGGTDTTSGLASNPVTGCVADKICELGGRVIMSETSEFIGAEHILAQRARTKEVAERIYTIVNAIEQEAKRRGVDIRGANPVPDNIAGGITTIEEKSLGAVLKGGSHIIEGVLGYGEKPLKPGLYLMDTPAPAIESLTGLLAGGAQVAIFTTGKGNIVGSTLMPTIKVCANKNTLESMQINIDYDASAVLSGHETASLAADKLLAMLISVCSGMMTKSEALQDVSIAIPRIERTV